MITPRSTTQVVTRGILIIATFGSEPIIGVRIKLSFKAVGKQNDRNALRSGALIGGWLEMMKLPLALGG
ncbi:hypothetical protein Tco_0245000, partial [Tanacetum coccineum]